MQRRGTAKTGGWTAERMLKLTAIIAFSLVALVLDSTVPDGFSGNILYVLPIVAAGHLRLGSPYWWAAAGTVLAIASSIAAPPGLPVAWEITDRAMTTFVLWITAALVAELRRRRTDAEAAKRDAETATLRKSRFLAAASHDLRQPAQALTLFAAVLRDKARGTTLEPVTEPMESAIAALNEMLTGLLELSRLDAGVVQPKIVQVDVPAIAQRLAAAYALQAEARGMRFRLRCHCDVTICSDPEFLERILRNLLDNAFKYTERGFVALTCFRRDGQVVFRVCDSGPGIAHEHQHSVFEEFFQVGNEERDRAKGLGIGLSVVQRSAALLGGGVRVWSRPGRGTIFTVVLPA